MIFNHKVADAAVVTEAEAVVAADLSQKIKDMDTHTEKVAAAVADQKAKSMPTLIHMPKVVMTARFVEIHLNNKDRELATANVVKNLEA